MALFIKRVLTILAVIIVIVVVSLIFISYKGLPTYVPATVLMEVPTDSATVALGKRLSQMNCNHCHAPLGQNRLVGRHVLEMGPELGEVYSANITQHPTAGIGRWTDGQLAYFLRTGVRPDSTIAPMYMPKFPRMADEDLEAIIAYLRSDDPAVQPSGERPPASQPSFLVKVLYNLVLKPYPYPRNPILKPDPADEVAYGEYLATGQLGCYQCHSADFSKVDALDPPQSEGFFGGGNKIYDHEGRLVLSANITFHHTGIGDYEEEEFVRVLQQGLKRDGTPLRAAMPPYPQLNDQEIRAIYRYLLTVPRLDNEIIQPEE